MCREFLSWAPTLCSRYHDNRKGSVPPRGPISIEQKIDAPYTERGPHNPSMATVVNVGCIAQKKVFVCRLRRTEDVPQNSLCRLKIERKRSCCAFSHHFFNPHQLILYRHNPSLRVVTYIFPPLFVHVQQFHRSCSSLTMCLPERQLTCQLLGMSYTPLIFCRLQRRLVNLTVAYILCPSYPFSTTKIADEVRCSEVSCSVCPMLILSFFHHKSHLCVWPLHSYCVLTYPNTCCKHQMYTDSVRLMRHVFVRACVYHTTRSILALVPDWLSPDLRICKETSPMC